MPLPSLEKITPQFDVTIPSTGKVLRFRPFVVAEEKILLLAVDGDEQQMLDAIIQVMKQCAISPLKVEDLSIFDIEYIMLQLRAKSVNEEVQLSYQCRNEVPAFELDERKRPTDVPLFEKNGERLYTTCANVVKMKLNLNDVQVHTSEGHTRQIHLSDELIITMKYPNLQTAKSVLKPKKGADSIIEALEGIALCVESVADAESVYTGFSLKEITGWLEMLTQPQFTKVQNFFDTMPKLYHDLDFHCKKCGHQETIHLESLSAFFV